MAMVVVVMGGCGSGVVVYCNKYIILLYCLYYFIMFEAKIKVWLSFNIFLIGISFCFNEKLSYHPLTK